MTRDLEERLRRALAGRAADPEDAPDPYERTLRGIRHARRRRGAVAGAGLGVLAAVGIPFAMPVWERDAIEVPDTRTSSVYEWPVRGSLADDGTFVVAARERATDCATRQQGDGEIGVAKLVYAGDNGVVRVAVTAVRGSAKDAFGEGSLVVTAGASGTPAPQLRCRPSVGRPIVRAQEAGSTIASLHWLAPRAGGATLFVLFPPKARTVEYSPGPRFHWDGTWERSWEKIGSDGSALVHFPEAPPSSAVVTASSHSRTTVVATAYEVGNPQHASNWPSGWGRVSRAPTPQDRAFRSLVGSSGLHPDELHRDPLWTGQAGAVVAVTSGEGATFQAWALGRESGTAAVARGRADQPLGVWLSRSGRAVIVAPRFAGGEAELLVDGEHVASAPVDASGYAEIPAGQAVSRGTAPLEFRVSEGGRAARDVLRDRSWGGKGPPWIRDDRLPR